MSSFEKGVSSVRGNRNEFIGKPFWKAWVIVSFPSQEGITKGGGKKYSVKIKLGGEDPKIKIILHSTIIQSIIQNGIQFLRDNGFAWITEKMRGRHGKKGGEIFHLGVRCNRFCKTDIDVDRGDGFTKLRPKMKSKSGIRLLFPDGLNGKAGREEYDRVFLDRNDHHLCKYSNEFGL